MGIQGRGRKGRLGLKKMIIVALVMIAIHSNSDSTSPFRKPVIIILFTRRALKRWSPTKGTGRRVFASTKI